MTRDDIKSMKLYSSVDRIYKDLEALGHGAAGPLDPEKLSTLDQLHYHGTETVDLALQTLGIRAGQRVMDIGSGFGGPARWIAHRSGARVSAVELQKDLHETAVDLTARCGLSRAVTHILGDIQETPLEAEAYDAAVSWLALYHIPNRRLLFPKIAKALKPGAMLFVEDLYERAPVREDEREALDVMLFARTLCSRAAYEVELEEAGFETIDFQDQTEDWAAFTAERLSAFGEAKTQKTALYGEQTVLALETFYATIARLLRGGRLGGVRLTAVKPG